MRWKFSIAFLVAGFIFILIDGIEFITGYSLLNVETYNIGIILLAIGFILGIGYKREH